MRKLYESILSLGFLTDVVDMTRLLSPGTCAVTVDGTATIVIEYFDGTDFVTFFTTSVTASVAVPNAEQLRVRVISGSSTTSRFVIYQADQSLVPVGAKFNHLTGRIKTATVGGRDMIADLGLYKPKTNYLTSAFAVVDDMTAAATAWNNNKTGCTLSDATDIIREDNAAFNALRVDITGVFTRFQRTLSPAVTFSGTVNTWLYFDADPTPGSSVELYFSSDAFATKHLKFAFTQANGFRKGWNCLSVNTGETGTTTGSTLTNTGAESFANPITAMRIVFNSLATGQVVRLGGIFHGGKATANVLLSYDDNYNSAWTIFNILRSRGIRASVGVISGLVGKDGRLTLSQLQQIYDWGWDLCPHSVTHPAGGLVNSTKEDARYELSESRAYLIRNGFTRAADCFFWPQNAYVSNVGVDLVGLAQQVGYSMARGSTRRDLATGQGIDNPMRLPSADLGGRTLAQAKTLIDAAILYGQTNVIYGHKLVGTATTPAAGGAAPVDALEWYWSDHAALADYIASKITAVTLSAITVSDLAAACRF